MLADSPAALAVQGAERHRKADHSARIIGHNVDAAVAIIGQSDTRTARRLSDRLNMRRTQIEAHDQQVRRVLAAKHASIAAGLGNAADRRQGGHRGNDAQLQTFDLKLAAVAAVVASIATRVVSKRPLHLLALQGNHSAHILKGQTAQILVVQITSQASPLPRLVAFEPGKMGKAQRR